MIDAKDWINKAVLNMQAYHVPTIPADALKLDAMEMPLDLPSAIKLKWRAGIIDVALNRYPLAKNERLEQLLREHFSINDKHNMLIGNGSDELIQIILTGMMRDDAVVMAPLPTFVMYEHVSKMLGMRFVGAPLHEHDFSLDIPAMLAMIEEHNPAVIFLANPNNPTGNLFDAQAIDDIIQATNGLVVIDEAYLPFVYAEQWQNYEAYDNVVVIRTLSKMGFAGLRFGYMFGPTQWVSQFDKVRPPYNVNVLTQYSIEFALDHLGTLQKRIAEIVEERTHLQQYFAQYDDIDVYSSQANFLVIRSNYSDRLYQQLISHNIWVKNLQKIHPMLANCLRISVSDNEENALLIKALDEILPTLSR